MVRVVRWCLRLGAIAAGIAAAGALSAQDTAANSLATLQENAAKRTTEWSTLATNLEQRMARLLPCDARVRTSVEEVSRASDARTVALTTYWTMVSIKSKAQVEAIRGLLAQEEGRADDWAKDRTDAQTDVAVTNAQAASLGLSLRQLPALANPQKSLEAITQMYRVLEGQTQERETSAGQLIDDLRELLRAGQARQSAIEDRIKAIGTEGLRWSGYYAARQARAQIECSITNPAAAAARPVPAPAPLLHVRSPSRYRPLRVRYPSRRPHGVSGPHPPGKKAMRPFIRSLFLVALAFAPLFAQQEREAQQEAYRNWRQTDPALERDATTAGATLGARADKAAAEGAKYFTARKAYLESLATDANQKASAVEAVNVAPDAAPSMEAFLSGQSTLLGSSIEAIARDPDRGIQQLRQALERERTALAAINEVLKDLQKIQEKVAQTSSSVEQERTQTSERYQKLTASLQQSAQLAEQSATAWANYYRALSDGARGVTAPVTSSAPVTSVAPVRSPNAPEPGPATVANPAPAAARGVTPVPLSRYVGAWTYPTVGAHYHGAQPEFVDLVVHEETGRASGTLYARFKLPPGGAGDPLVRFDFEGAFQSSRSEFRGHHQQWGERDRGTDPRAGLQSARNKLRPRRTARHWFAKPISCW